MGKQGVAYQLLHGAINWDKYPINHDYWPLHNLKIIVIPIGQSKRRQAYVMLHPYHDYIMSVLQKPGWTHRPLGGFSQQIFYMVSIGRFRWVFSLGVSWISFYLHGCFSKPPNIPNHPILNIFNQPSILGVPNGFRNPNIRFHLTLDLIGGTQFFTFPIESIKSHCGVPCDVKRGSFPGIAHHSNIL